MKTLGLNLGTNLISFCLIDEFNKKIDLMGVHLFDRAEHPKNGASLALPRREARSARRLIKRRNMRKKRLIYLFQKYNFTDNEKIISDNTSKLNPWTLRKEGLDRELSDLEFQKVLYHINNRRGFKSNKKENKEPNNGKKNQAMDALEASFRESNKRTIGEFLADKEIKTNTINDYSHTVKRSLIEEELAILLTRQRDFGNKKISDEMKKEITETILFQRPLKSIAERVGFCTHIPEEKRAPKFSFSAELFVFWSKLNNLKLWSENGEIPITIDMKNKLYEEALCRSSISYAQIRKLWDLKDSITFNLVRYFKAKKKNEEKDYTLDDFEKEKFFEFKGYHTFRKIIENIDSGLWQLWKNDRQLLNFIAEVVSFEFDELSILFKLKQHPKLKNVAEDILKQLTNINDFSKTINLSLKAAEILLPFLQKGKSYAQAVKSAYFQELFIYNEAPSQCKKLPPFEGVNNPVVNRAISQCRKIINAIIKKYGMIDNINIELHREIGKSWEVRKKIENKQLDNKHKNEEIRLRIRHEHHHEPSKEDLIKYKLWQEQLGFCPYSGVYIDPAQIFNPQICEIDYILPYSRVFDSSFFNMVLSRVSENRDKGNRTPYEAWGDTNKWASIESHVSRFNKEKRRRFLMKTLNEEEEFYKRANNTNYVAQELKSYLKNNLNINVFCVNSGIISHLKHVWGLSWNQNEENMEFSYTYYGIDAAIIACANPFLIKQVTSFNKKLERERWKKENEKTPNLQKPFAPIPWDGFKDMVEDMIEKIFVSRLPNRKISGSLHAETLKSYRPSNQEGKQIVKRISLSNVNLKNLEDIIDKECNIKLYNLLKERLEINNGDSKKAFKDPIYMTRNNNTNGPIIKRIRVYDNSRNGFILKKAYVENGDLIRLDIFSKNNEYFYAPLYAMDAIKKQLPNKLCVAGKPKNEWLDIDDSYEFKFSLYKNDYVVLKDRSGEILEGYFLTLGITNASIVVCGHKNTLNSGKKGKRIKNLVSFEKYKINYFGERFLVNKEKRVNF